VTLKKGDNIRRIVKTSSLAFESITLLIYCALIPLLENSNVASETTTPIRYPVSDDVNVEGR
jgi:hypothetical protein